MARPTSGDVANFDVAKICMNGHVANAYTKLRPDSGGAFCGACGEKTITACPNCDESIRGPYIGPPTFVSDYERPDSLSIFESPESHPPAIDHSFNPPLFCINCGSPYPWTQRKLQEARELIRQAEALTADEKLALEADVNDLTRDAPRTLTAAIRIRAVLARVPGVVGSALRDIIVEVASEAAKKIILGP